MSIREISENTSVSFKIVAPIVTTIVIGTWIVSAKLTAMESALNDGWTIGQHSRWSNKLRGMNPAINVPYAEDFKKGNQ